MQSVDRLEKNQAWNETITVQHVKLGYIYSYNYTWTLTDKPDHSMENQERKNTPENHVIHVAAG